MPADPNIERVNRLFDGWYSVLVHYALRLTGRLDLAEDVVQEAFYLLYRELVSGKAIANEKAWTFCVVRRETIRQLHRYQVREISLDSPEFLGSAWQATRNDDLPHERLRPGTPAAQESMKEQGNLSHLFSFLSPREEEVMLLCMEALKYREIGVALGISSNSVATLHRRAIHKLRIAMGLEPKPAKSRGEAKTFRDNTVPMKTSSL